MRSFLTFGVIFISCIIAALGKPDVEKVEESTAAATTPPPLVGMESKEVDWNQFLQDLEAQSESSERTTTADTEPEQVDWTQFLKDLQAQAESSERTATPPLIDMEAEEIDWSKFHEDLETQLKGAEDANEEEAAAVAMKTKAGKNTVKKTSPPKTAKAGKNTGPAIEEEAAAFDKETEAEKTSQPKAKKTSPPKKTSQPKAKKTSPPKKTSQPKAKKTSPPKKTGDTKSGKITPPATEEGTIDASTERTTSTSLSSSNTNTRVTAGLRSADADVLSTSKPSGFWLLISLASLVVVLAVVKYVWNV
ncbi:hypothetical protein ACHAWC_009617 [Mediolabrus comicus]